MAVTPKLAAVTIFTGIAFFGLAILGSGGATAYFSNPARIALTVSGLAMFVVALFSPGNISTGEREDRANRWVLAGFSAIGLLMAYLPAYTDRIGFWSLDGDLVRWLGVALFTVGGVVRIWPVFVLGRRFSGLVAIQPGHTLVTTGVYRVIRHPSYLGLLINSLGWVLSFRSIAGMLLLVFIIPPLLVRINAEEKLLRAYFGDEYEVYCAHTPWRLIPGLY